MIKHLSHPPRPLKIQAGFGNLTLLICFLFSFFECNADVACATGPVAPACVTRCGAGPLTITASGHSIANQDYYWYDLSGNLIEVNKGVLDTIMPANTTIAYFVSFHQSGTPCSGVGSVVKAISDPVRVSIIAPAQGACPNQPTSFAIKVENVDCQNSHDISAADQFVTTSGGTFTPTQATSPAFGTFTLAPGASRTFVTPGYFTAPGAYTYKALVNDLTDGCPEDKTLQVQVQDLDAGFRFENNDDGVYCSDAYPLTATATNEDAGVAHTWALKNSSGQVIYTVTGSSFRVDPSQASYPPGVYSLTHTVSTANCTLALTRQVYVFGKNRRFAFDGIDDRISVPNITSYQFTGREFTLESWITAPATVQGDRTIVSKGDWNTDGFIFKTDGNSLFFQSGTVQLRSDAFTMSIFDGACHHVAVSRKIGAAPNDEHFVFYLDGSEAGDIYGSPFQITSSASLWLGADATGAALNWEGTLDDFRIWSVFKDEPGIFYPSLGYVPGNAPGLLGYWPLNENSAQTLLDYSAAANHAILGTSLTAEGEDPVSDNESCQLNICDLSTARAANPRENPGKPAKVVTENIEILLYPNPTTSESMLEIRGEDAVASDVCIMSLAGQVIYKAELPSNTRLAVGKFLKPGLYLVQVKTQGFVKMLKLIKN